MAIFYDNTSQSAKCIENQTFRCNNLSISYNVFINVYKQAVLLLLGGSKFGIL